MQYEYRKIAMTLESEGKLTTQWQSFEIHRDAGQWGFGERPALGTAWWLGGSHNVSADVRLEARCTADHIQVRNLKANWVWKDVIDANDISEWWNDKKQGGAKGVISGIPNLPIESVFWDIAMDKIVDTGIMKPRKRAYWSSAVVAVAGAVVLTLLLYAAVGSSSARGIVANSSELSWGREVVESIQPRGDVFREVQYDHGREHRFARIFGRCSGESFEQFSKHYRLEPLDGDLWNNRLGRVPTEVRGDFVFNKRDRGFIGVIELQGEGPIGVEGAYSPSTGHFLLELKSMPADASSR